MNDKILEKIKYRNTAGEDQLIDSDLNEIMTESLRDNPSLASRVIVWANTYMRDNDITPSEEAYRTMFQRTAEKMEKQPELIYHLPEDAQQIIRDEYRRKINDYIQKAKVGMKNNGKKMIDLYDEIKDNFRKGTHRK